MITFEENIELPTNLQSAFSIIGDFSNITEWDPGIASVRKITKGEIRVGTEFEIYANFFFQKVPMKYTLIEYEVNKKVIYIGEAENVKAVDMIEFFESKSGCLLKYKADFEFKGFLSTQESLLKIILRNTANNAFAGMRKAFSPVESIKNETRNEMSYKFFLPIIYDFSKFGYNSSKKNFKAVATDLKTKVAVVTGASSGIGFETSLKLARRQATVILCGRNEKKLDSAKSQIISETGNQSIFIEIADLSLMQETKSLAERILKKFDSVDILINNAGAMFNERVVTQEGFEKSIALLLYSPYLLTNLLLPLLQKSKSGSRIVNVSSGGMYAQKLDLDDLESKENYSGERAYAKAKRGLVILSEFWAKNLKEKNISSFCMHPGWADTEAVQTSLPRFYSLTKPILRSPEEGADTIYWLSASAELENKTGGFYLDRKMQPTHVFFTQSSISEENKFLDYMDSFLKKYT